MGWATGTLDGRDIGYGIKDTCKQEGCGETITRGLSYVCGGVHGGGERGCGDYFCGNHLGYVVVAPGTFDQLCDRCAAALPDEEEVDV